VLSEQALRIFERIRDYICESKHKAMFQAILCRFGSDCGRSSSQWWSL